MPRHKKRQLQRKQSRDRLGTDGYKALTKAVSSPSAENARHQQAVSPEETLAAMVEKARLLIMRTSRPLYYCFILQLEYTLRISEVLGIQPEHIDNQGGTLIKGKKGGKDRHIHSVECAPFLLSAKKEGVPPFRDLNDTYVRRQYRKVGLVYHAPGRQKAAVTHAFRHIAADNIRSQNLGNEVVTDKLNHKSSKTQEWYGRK
jgi:integrase